MITDSKVLLDYSHRNHKLGENQRVKIKKKTLAQVWSKVALGVGQSSTWCGAK